MREFLLPLQIIISILLIISVLVQQRGEGLSSAFGGSSGEFYSTRRGVQKNIFWATIILAVLFIGLTLLNLLT